MTEEVKIEGLADLINALADVVILINLYDEGKMDEGSTLRQIKSIVQTLKPIPLEVNDGS